MSLQPLPVGTQSFTKLRQEGRLYVDKTELIYRMVRIGGVYFLSRPRRFGKSLLISTLDAIFRGQKELFEGLWIGDSDYNWQEYPVVRIDFSRISSRNDESVQSQLKLKLVEIAREYSLAINEDLEVSSYLDQIFVEFGKQGKQVAVLIDEYDKPINDNILNPDKAEAIRLLLRDFYTIIKAQDANIRFVLLTGISKFAKMSIFSGLNNLYDMSMDDGYAGILGYTQGELESYFDAHIEELVSYVGLSKQETLDKIKLWYNGYRFSSKGVSVYNPFATLTLFRKRIFSNHWFETATPTLLINVIRDKHFDIGKQNIFEVSESAFAGYEVGGDIPVIPLLYQAGYLTIGSYDEEFNLYSLTYPNKEVEDAFHESLLGNYSHLQQGDTGSYVVNLVRHIRKGDLTGFFTDMRLFFCDVPNSIQISQEKYYQTIFYCILKLLGVHVDAEVNTNIGRIDVVMRTKNAIYIVEFKLNGTKEEALQQIKDKGYAEKYKADGRPVTLIGVEFDKDTRNILDSGWVVEGC